MKTLQESVNFILADESMRYVEQDGRVRETGTKLFYKYFGEQKEKLKSKDYQILKKWVLEEIKTVNLSRFKIGRKKRQKNCSAF